jgi:hypothetical protein
MSGQQHGTRFRPRVEALDGRLLPGTIVPDALFTEGDPTGSLGAPLAATGAETAITATVTWDDGQVTAAHAHYQVGQAGPVSFTTERLFLSEGTHTYTLRTFATEADGTVKETDFFNLTAQVADAPLSVTAQPLNATTGVALDPSTVVALLKDGNWYAAPGDNVATIFWGDGMSSQGTIVPVTDPVAGKVAGEFEVLGTHAYAQAGTYSMEVTVQDKNFAQHVQANDGLAVSAADQATVRVTDGVAPPATSPSATTTSDQSAAAPLLPFSFPTRAVRFKPTRFFRLRVGQPRHRRVAAANPYFQLVRF